MAARKKSLTLTEGELQLMRVLWRLGRATAQEVLDAVPVEGRAPAYSTVRTMLRILERKGYVVREKSGRAFVYRAVVDSNEAKRSAVKHLLKRFFDDSAGQLVVNLLNESELDAAELAELRRMIGEADGRTR